MQQTITLNDTRDDAVAEAISLLGEAALFNIVQHSADKLFTVYFSLQGRTLSYNTKKPKRFFRAELVLDLQQYRDSCAENNVNLDGSWIESEANSLAV